MTSEQNGGPSNPDPVWEPPLAGTDVQHLVGSLERIRATFSWKAWNLPDEQLTRTVGASNLSLAGLLKHLACVEDEMFGWKFHGERPENFVRFNAGHEDDDDDLWMFTLDPGQTGSEVYEAWSQGVGRSRVRLQRVIDEGGFDRPAHLAWGDEHVSFRRLMHDVIEEYSRHTGHADLLREAIDGRVGEDPPRTWLTPAS
ncbi:mycothiol transferase [Aestuariimicrobium sp. T2.26MG-19.2B]|uniref:mycothiol transferase n=1 Tax=Aestuariimicrobium sp. T2.26MG-19.2B TaxID=3040679 RepID=UPI002477A70B|nr:DUF664 domain-containing protein [Aestuariimicrobium sp. T2.26MG-19.2B]CAI9400798.1 hypothetical protein AESSP_00462 [Aestuariimicrobium sp. T2.26MG-19.2B]